MRCALKENGMAVPFIGSDVKCILIGEAPGENEIISESLLSAEQGSF